MMPPPLHLSDIRCRCFPVTTGGRVLTSCCRSVRLSVRLSHKIDRFISGRPKCSNSSGCAYCALQCRFLCLRSLLHHRNYVFAMSVAASIPRQMCFFRFARILNGFSMKFAGRNHYHAQIK